jgi:hypothetical protein
MSDRLVWPNLDGAWSRENAQRSMQRHQLAGAHDAGTGMRRLAAGDGRRAMGACCWLAHLACA